jgi:hypothetical protein
MLVGMALQLTLQEKEFRALARLHADLYAAAQATIAIVKPFCVHGNDFSFLVLILEREKYENFFICFFDQRKGKTLIKCRSYRFQDISFVFFHTVPKSHP